MKLRAGLFWVHLFVGVTVSAVVLVMATTGVLLTYERQVVQWYDTYAYRAPRPRADARHLPPSTLLQFVRERYPSSPIANIVIRRDESAPAEIGVDRAIVFINPYNAYVWGEATEGPRAFFRVVTAWHRALGATGRDGTVRHSVAAACNFALLLMVLTGAILWSPRTWTQRTVGNIIWFRRRLPPRARDFNWHHAVGFWSALPLTIIVLGGVVMSYPWAGSLLFRMVGETPEPPRGGAPAAARPQGVRPGGRRDAPPRGALAADVIDARWAAAERQVPGWHSIALRMPASADAPLEFTIEEGTGGQPQYRSTLTLDAPTGAVRSWARFRDRSLGGRLRTYLRFSHTGEAGGFIGQTIVGIASAAACLLIWTGVSLAWRRFAARGSSARLEAAESVMARR